MIFSKYSAVYRDRGRGSTDWKELKGKTTDMMDKAKKKWYEVEKLMTKGANHIAYKALQHLSTAERKTIWNVMHIRPNRSEGEVAEELADYFAGIAQELPPINDHDIPTTYEREVRELTEEEVLERLVAMKKSKSYVSSDIPPKAVNGTAAAVAPVLTYIINGIL